jgi:hypothetical protein
MSRSTDLGVLMTFMLDNLDRIYRIDMIINRPLATLVRDAENAEMMNHLSDSLRGGIRQNVPSAVGGKCQAAIDLGLLKLNANSGPVKYDDLPRERDSNLIRFLLSGNLIKKLRVL